MSDESEEHFGEGELFYQHYVARQDSYNELQKLIEKEEREQLPKKQKEKTRVQEKKTEKKDPLGGTRLSLRRLMGISTFFGVCAVLTMNFEDKDKGKVFGVLYALLTLGAFDLIVAMRFSAARW